MSAKAWINGLALSALLWLGLSVALIGLTILSLPSQPGATVVHAIALEP